MSENLFTSQYQSYIKNKLPQIALASVKAVMAMAEEGATVPFMARYRKEKTGNIDEVQIRDILDFTEKWQELIKRKEFIIETLTEQKNLSPELKAQIDKTEDLRELEEIYRPYKRKKKTKAMLAKDAGLEPFADWIWAMAQGGPEDSTSMEVKSKDFINVEKAYVTYQELLRGAQHIICERIYNSPELRDIVKNNYFTKGIVTSQKTTKFKEKSKYDMYADFKEEAKTLLSQKASHRYLALRRGWKEGELKVAIHSEDEMLLEKFVSFACPNNSTQVKDIVHEAAKQALTVHVVPSVVNELHSFLKDEADISAIDVFANNVQKILMSSPFGSKVTLGVDPGLKTGCKLALVDQSGNFISNTVMHILSEKDYPKGKKLFEEVMKQITIEAIAVGNGTGGREAESFIRKILKDLGKEQVPVIMVSESGASVYSASAIAREEFPDLDLTVRGAISIARRLQDPLAELVKIDPKSIGVGQYQHDVSETRLKKSLDNVVESCVNQVGVNLNTASGSLLQFVSGIGPALSKNIVEYRKEKGKFKERSELLKVPRLSSKVFEQAAGFLRIPDGVIALDKTGIHPEKYSAVQEMSKEVGTPISKLMSGDLEALKAQKDKWQKQWQKLIGEYTFNDILDEFAKPGRDPRDPFKVFKYREDIHEIKDLKKDMICPGLVTNVTNFGAFVDVGVHQDGLVHISVLSHQFVDDPRKIVSPGDQVQVKVISVDEEKKQIAFSMLLTEKPKPKARPASKAKGKKTGGDRKASGKKNFNKNRKKNSRKPSDRKPRPPRNNFNNNPFAAALGDLKK